MVIIAYKKNKKKNPRIIYNNNIKEIEEEKEKFVLLKIPQTFDVLKFLEDLHSEDGHREINSSRNYIIQRNFYVDGATILTNYILKNCATCLEKTRRVKLKREPSKQILTFYPRQRYVMDLSELHNRYLFCIIDHFSKFGMAFIFENKEANTILKYLKLALDCNGYPEEI